MRANDADPLSGLSVIAGRIGTWYLDRAVAVQVLLVWVLLVAKNAFDIELRNIQEAYIPAAEAFPSPVGYVSASFGQMGLAHLLGLSTTPAWVGFHGFLVVIGLLWLSVLAVRQLRTDPGSALLVLAATTAASTLLLTIGKYDVLTVVGGATLVLARSLPVGAVGAVLMAAGNPEQAIVASLALLILSLAPEFRRVRTRALFSMGTAMLVWGAVLIWFQASGVEAGRLSLLPTYLGTSLGNTLASLHLTVWSWLGAGWLIVIAAVVLVQRRSRVALLVAAIVLPGIASVITADGARVFAAVVAPVFIVVGLWLSEAKVNPSKFRTQVIGAFIVALILLPTAIPTAGWFDGQVRGRLISIGESVFGPPDR